VPKGFEKYYPGGKKTPPKPEEAPKSETKGWYNFQLSFAAVTAFTFAVLHRY